MQIAIDIVLFLHLIGMASLVGGSLAQLKTSPKTVTPFMLHGALTQLVTGFILVGLLQAHKETVDMAVVGVKMTFLLVIFVLIYFGRKKLSDNAFYSILSLSLTNVALALFVTSAS